VVSLLALLVAGGLGVCFLRHAYGVVSFPYELAAGEELLLRDAVHLARGQAVYTDPNDFPFVISNYPPLFAALSALLVSLVGVSLSATRIVATLSTLLCGALVGAITYQGSGLRVPSVVCGGAFLGSLFVYQWGAWGRVDSTAILLSLLAILVLQRLEDWRGITLAALCCLLSLYTKQTEWAAPLAILGWLLWRHQGRRALGFVFLLAGGGGLVFLTLNALTSGEFFRHLVVYNALPYSPRAVLGYWRAFAVTHGAVLGLALVYAGLAVARRRPSLPVTYFVASGLLTLSVGRAGASSNYFLELIGAALILCGLWWGELSRRPGYTSAVVPALLLVQMLWFRAFALSPLEIYYHPLPSFGYTPDLADVQSCQQIDDYVKQAGGEILTEGGGFALRDGKELYGSPWMLSMLERTGLVDQGLLALESALQEHRFSLVILTWQSFPPRILDAVWVDYQRVDAVECVFRYEIFVPRGAG
jgi:hypothetical protein